MRFYPAPEYQVFPTRERPLKPYEAVVQRRRRDAPGDRATSRPDVVVNDVLTLAPALAAELEGVPLATLVPHFYPPTAARRAALRARRDARAHAARPRALAGAPRARSSRGVERGRRELNETRRRVGLPPLERHYGGISERPVPRRRPSRSSSTRARGRPGVHVTGPARLAAARRRVGMGRRATAPRVLVAPSTAQDPGQTPAARRAARASRACRCACSPCAGRARPDLPARAERARSSSGSATSRRCRARTWSSATPGTARSRPRSRAGRRS